MSQGPARDLPRETLAKGEAVASDVRAPAAPEPHRYPPGVRTYQVALRVGGTSRQLSETAAALAHAFPGIEPLTGRRGTFRVSVEAEARASAVSHLSALIAGLPPELTRRVVVLG